MCFILFACFCFGDHLSHISLITLLPLLPCHTGYDFSSVTAERLAQRRGSKYICEVNECN